MPTLRTYTPDETTHLNELGLLADAQYAFTLKDVLGIVPVANGVVIVDFQSLPGHRFTWAHGDPTGGLIGAMTVDLNNVQQYKFTGLSIPFVQLFDDIQERQLHAAAQLLLEGNDRIFPSVGNNRVFGDADGHNTFFFAGDYGKNKVVGWSVLDKLAFSAATSFDSYADILNNSHIYHGAMVIVDPNNYNNTITIPGIDEKHDLRPSELLFLHH